jgi:hypothetical protein
LLPALCALHRDFYALADAGSLGGGNGRQSLVLGLLAGFATLGFVLQTLVVKEDLFASSPDEILSTVNAFDRAIRKLRLGVTPLPIRFAH